MKTIRQRADEITRRVCYANGFAVSDVLSPGRHKSIVRVRSMITYVMREAMQISYKEIVQMTRPCTRSHATAIHRYKSAVRLCDPTGNGFDPAFARTAKEIVALVRKERRDELDAHYRQDGGQA